MSAGLLPSHQRASVRHCLCDRARKPTKAHHPEIESLTGKVHPLETSCETYALTQISKFDHLDHLEQHLHTSLLGVSNL